MFASVALQTTFRTELHILVVSAPNILPCRHIGRANGQLHSFLPLAVCLFHFHEEHTTYIVETLSLPTDAHNVKKHRVIKTF